MKNYWDVSILPYTSILRCICSWQHNIVKSRFNCTFLPNVFQDTQKSLILCPWNEKNPGQERRKSLKVNPLMNLENAFCYTSNSLAFCCVNVDGLFFFSCTYSYMHNSSHCVLWCASRWNKDSFFRIYPVVPKECTVACIVKTMALRSQTFCFFSTVVFNIDHLITHRKIEHF